MDFVYDAYSGDPSLSATVGIVPDYDNSVFLPGDVADQQQMAPWTAPAAQQQGMSWWEGVAAYGMTRAIDNAFPGSPTGTWGNVYPGSMAGYNGGTYTARPIGAGGGVAQASGRVMLGGNGLGLLLMAAAAFLILKK